MVDPFTQVYDAIWSMLEANDAFVALVPEKNRVKYVNRDPVKQEVLTHDFPEVRVAPAGGSLDLNATNREGSARKQYSIQVATGTRDLLVLYPLEWACVQALLTWRTAMEDLEFVAGVRVPSLLEGVRQEDLNRGVAGWVNILVVEVEMYFEGG